MWACNGSFCPHWILNFRLILSLYAVFSPSHGVIPARDFFYSTLCSILWPQIIPAVRLWSTIRHGNEPQALLHRIGEVHFALERSLKLQVESQLCRPNREDRWHLSNKSRPNSSVGAAFAEKNTQPRRWLSRKHMNNGMKQNERKVYKILFFTAKKW